MAVGGGGGRWVDVGMGVGRGDAVLVAVLLTVSERKALGVGVGLCRGVRVMLRVPVRVLVDVPLVEREAVRVNTGDADRLRNTLRDDADAEPRKTEAERDGLTMHKRVGVGVGVYATIAVRDCNGASNRVADGKGVRSCEGDTDAGGAPLLL